MSGCSNCKKRYDYCRCCSRCEKFATECVCVCECCGQKERQCRGCECKEESEVACHYDCQNACQCWNPDREIEDDEFYPDLNEGDIKMHCGKIANDETDIFSETGICCRCDRIYPDFFPGYFSKTHAEKLEILNKADAEMQRIKDDSKNAAQANPKRQKVEDGTPVVAAAAAYDSDDDIPISEMIAKANKRKTTYTFVPRTLADIKAEKMKQ